MVRNVNEHRLRDCNWQTSGKKNVPFEKILLSILKIIRRKIIIKNNFHTKFFFRAVQLLGVLRHLVCLGYSISNFTSIVPFVSIFGPFHQHFMVTHHISAKISTKHKTSKLKKIVTVSLNQSY